MTLPIVRSARLTFWSVLLLVWGGLAIFWTWRILSDAGGNGLHIGSLALAIGSAFLALYHIDAARRRVWITLAVLFIGASLLIFFMVVPDSHRRTTRLGFVCVMTLAPNTDVRMGHARPSTVVSRDG